MNNELPEWANEPIGRFLSNQGDICPPISFDGCYWTYKDIVTLLKRYEDFIKDHEHPKTNAKTPEKENRLAMAVYEAIKPYLCYRFKVIGFDKESFESDRKWIDVSKAWFNEFGEEINDTYRITKGDFVRTKTGLLSVCSKVAGIGFTGNDARILLDGDESMQLYPIDKIEKASVVSHDNMPLFPEEDVYLVDKVTLFILKYKVKDISYSPNDFYYFASEVAAQKKVKERKNNKNECHGQIKEFEILQRSTEDSNPEWIKVKKIKGIPGGSETVSVYKISVGDYAKTKDGVFKITELILFGGLAVFEGGKTDRIALLEMPAYLTEDGKPLFLGDNEVYVNRGNYDISYGIVKELQNPNYLSVARFQSTEDAENWATDQWISKNSGANIHTSKPVASEGLDANPKENKDIPEFVSIITLIDSLGNRWELHENFPEYTCKKLPLWSVPRKLMLFGEKSVSDGFMKIESVERCLDEDIFKIGDKISVDGYAGVIKSFKVFGDVVELENGKVFNITECKLIAEPEGLKAKLEPGYYWAKWKRRDGSLGRGAFIVEVLSDGELNISDADKIQIVSDVLKYNQ